MEAWIYNLHLEAGERCGRERTCGNKIRHRTEEEAIKAADSLNKRIKKEGREVEHYPCPFCCGWHVGKKFSIDRMIRIVKGE